MPVYGRAVPVIVAGWVGCSGRECGDSVPGRRRARMTALHGSAAEQGKTNEIPLGVPARLPSHRLSSQRVSGLHGLSNATKLHRISGSRTLVSEAQAVTSLLPNRVSFSGVRHSEPMRLCTPVYGPSVLIPVRSTRNLAASRVEPHRGSQTLSRFEGVPMTP